MIDPTYPLYPVLASASLVALLAPSPWHWKNKNIGTLLFIGWTVLGIIIYVTNSIVWKGSLQNRAPVWCDISTKFMVALSAAQPACSLIINMRLYYISTIKQVRITKSDNRRRAVIDLSIGVGIPSLLMALHYVNQGHRYDIVENIGCYPSTYLTPVALPTLFLWPILLCTISLVYAVLAIRSFLRQRKQFSDILQTMNSGLTVNRYFRLMALAGTSIIFTLPLALYIFINNCLYGINPWISWADTHYNFNRVEFYPFAIFRQFPQALFMVNITRFALVTNGIFFFMFFGLAGESGVFYRRAFWRVAGIFGFSPKPIHSPGASWVAQPGASGNLAPPFARAIPHTNNPTPEQKNHPTSSTVSSLDYDDFGDEKIDSSSVTTPGKPERSHSTHRCLPPYVGNDVV